VVWTKVKMRMLFMDRLCGAESKVGLFVILLLLEKLT
jgi:hypothetical protein